MNKEEAKEFLTHYICCCPYGTSPDNCGDNKCVFGMAIRILCNEEKTQEETDTYPTKEDYKYNKKKHRWEKDND